MSDASAPSRSNVKRVVALKLIIMRFAELAQQLGMKLEGSKRALEVALDKAIVAEKLIRSIEMVFLRPSGALFVYTLIEIDWRLHGAIVERQGSDEISLTQKKGEIITDVISPALSDVLWYLERRFRAEGIGSMKWYVNWRTESRDDPSIRERARAVSRDLGFVPLTESDQKVLNEAEVKREIKGGPSMLSESGVLVREY